MTHTDADLNELSLGSHTAVVHIIDITSLDEAGAETYDPSSEVNIAASNRTGVEVAGQENSTVDITHNHKTNHLNVTLKSDGSKAANNVATGEVKLLVHSDKRA